ncbi:MAG: MFS transporter [Actinomycetes bacterium]
MTGTETTPRASGLAHWFPMLVLAAAQFVMVLDSTVMNVSISTVVKDLDTTIPDMQMAIACFTLVMAAFMLAGAGLGNRLGRLRTFRIGLAIYAIGSGATALAVGFPMLFVGWSVIEGLGAVLVIPAIAALTAANYSGRDRALAFGILGGIAGAAAAAGPVIGGYMTTYLSWRYVFAAEVVICLAVIAVSRRIVAGPPVAVEGRFDLVGVGLSALGFGTIVISLVKAGQWGWVKPRSAPFEVLGFSPTIPLVVAGLFVLWGFLEWETRAAARGDALLDPAMLRIGSLADGLGTLTIQQFVIGGVFFVLPLYLQIVLGLDALGAGLKILPLSIALFVASFAGAALASRFAPRVLVRVGVMVVVVGIVGCVGTIDLQLDRVPFAASMAVIGLGLGLCLSQIGNVLQSSVDVSRSNEVGGLQGTAQNIGASLGTAVIGAILLSGLGLSFTNAVQADPRIPASVKAEVRATTSNGVAFISSEQAAAALEAAGVPEADRAPLLDAYESSQIQALKTSLACVALVGLLAFVTSRRIQRSVLAGPVAAD